MIWLIILSISVSINADTITVLGDTSFATYSCSDKYIQITLQYSSSYGSVSFHTSDSCSSMTYYSDLSTGALPSYSGTLSSSVSSETVCFIFHKDGLFSSTVTYSLSVTCGSWTRNWGIFLFIILPIVLGLICCCVCIRYFYKRANAPTTFVRVEEQHRVIPLQVIVPSSVTTDKH